MIIFSMILGFSKMIKFRKSRITRGKNVPTMVFSKFANLPSYSHYKSVFFVAIFNFFVHLKFLKRLFLFIFNWKVIFIFNCDIFFKKKKNQKMPTTQPFTEKKYQHLNIKYQHGNIVFSTYFGIQNVIS